MTKCDFMAVWVAVMTPLIFMFWAAQVKTDCEWERMELLSNVCELSKIDNTANRVTFSCDGKPVTIQAQGRNIDRAFNEWF